ncbi:hypothetical protein CAL29_02025 [Bordetella genomosp. 10]|uniref:Lipoprotein n=1 Tax=Bordetella genomosp. 10 TaxID=1416804 RepID=A0A261SIG7_9BORD|nr:hypothetical protein [Bordetella genomosp. 10]OZI37229.1 hypothetical protein CAL29_02025 [Bordetella genomosp. 10]
MLNRLLLASCFLILLSACASRPDEPKRSSSCHWWNSCSYDGPYEPGEADYARDEAQRLNAAEAAKLRRQQ